MPYGITQCYLPPAEVRIRLYPQPNKQVLDLATPDRRDARLSWLMLRESGPAGNWTCDLPNASPTLCWLALIFSTNAPDLWGVYMLSIMFRSDYSIVRKSQHSQVCKDPRRQCFVTLDLDRRPFEPKINGFPGFQESLRNIFMSRLVIL